MGRDTKFLDNLKMSTMKTDWGHCKLCGVSFAPDGRFGEWMPAKSQKGGRCADVKGCERRLRKQGKR